MLRSSVYVTVLVSVELTDDDCVCCSEEVVDGSDNSFDEQDVSSTVNAKSVNIKTILLNIYTSSFI
jgi:hypothetical protein